jgi:hypothetical protein
MGKKMIDKLGHKLHYKEMVEHGWRNRSVF